MFGVCEGVKCLGRGVCERGKCLGVGNRGIGGLREVYLGSVRERNAWGGQGRSLGSVRDGNAWGVCLRGGSVAPGGVCAVCEDEEGLKEEEEICGGCLGSVRKGSA